MKLWEIVKGMSEGKYGDGDRFSLREYNNNIEIEISSYIPSTDILMIIYQYS